PSLFFSLCLALPVSPLFPYTTLFRSCGLREHLRWCKHGQWQDDHDAKGHLVCTACPPNSLRSAAITLAPKDSSWRERSRASSDNVMTGAGTFRRIASSTVHRPSPESST